MDCYGKALSDFYHNKKTQTLWINTSYGEPEEMPVKTFFRDYEEMPELEQMALDLCKGKILDAGAGAGSHSLYLQQNDFDVSALEISAAACEIMRSRGVRNVINQDFFVFNAQRFDTLLLLMNGIGLCGDLKSLPDLLKKAKGLLNPGGRILMDSSDISYLYQDIERPADKYFGELSYQYLYEEKTGNWFNWLYVDQQKLAEITNLNGWNCEIIFEDWYDQYLARLTVRS